MKIGVIGIQGDVSEHVIMMQKTLKETNTPGEVFIVKTKENIDEIDALILPGGESTTISKILNKSGLYTRIQKRIKENNLPTMGTCAGCVLLAKKLTDTYRDVTLLEAMDIQVTRNAFGRQKESFEKNLRIDGLHSMFNAVFIRAPVIEKTWGNCKPLAKIDKKIVMARQGNLLALSFHPELTRDTRIHKYFLEMII
ncbi:MAG: pyridoxal 5'-phosphate synthase glutaminase subunit PdxT [Thermoplasmata archaeon]|nr:MAG: pyridoxal 5'-phosphate synthase glutaminase subunit PdxT [Thermoplasmata archaeon]